MTDHRCTLGAAGSLEPVPVTTERTVQRLLYGLVCDAETLCDCLLRLAGDDHREKDLERTVGQDGRRDPHHVGYERGEVVAVPRARAAARDGEAVALRETLECPTTVG